MGLQDEMALQKIEVLLDIQAKRIQAELNKLREELSQAKEELRKEIHSVRQDASFPQAGPSRVQMYADAPPMQEPQPVPRYAQEQQAPRYAQQPQQGYPQQAPAQYAQQAQPYPQQGYPQQAPQGYAEYPQMPAGRVERERPPEARPIDRNGVAPADVSVEKFFNFSGTGGKRK